MTFKRGERAGGRVSVGGWVATFTHAANVQQQTIPQTPGRIMLILRRCRVILAFFLKNIFIFGFPASGAQMCCWGLNLADNAEE